MKNIAEALKNPLGSKAVREVRGATRFLGGDLLGGLEFMRAKNNQAPLADVLKNKIKQGVNIAKKGIKLAKEHPVAVKKALAVAHVLKAPSMKKGGMAKVTAPHLLHKGELVLPAHVVKKMSSLM